MVRHIVAREFLDSLISLRFAISTVLCVFLILVSAYVSTEDYVDRLRDHNAAVAAHQKEDERRRMHWPKIYRKPRPLAVFSEGVEKRVGNVVEIWERESPFQARGYGWQSRETEYMASFDSIDVAFVIEFVLSLLAIFLAYDAVSGERESGVVRLVLSHSISRGAVLIGKLLGRLLCILLPLTIGIIIGLLFLVIHPSIQLSGADWVRVCLLYVIALLYVCVFLCAGLAVSSLARSSGSSLIVLLTMWVLAVAVHPVLRVIAAEHLRPIDRPEVMERNVLRIEKEYRKRSDEAFALAKEMEKQGKWKERREYVVQGSAIGMEGAEVVDRIRQGFLRQFSAQESFAGRLSRVSPAGCFSSAAESIAATDIHAYDRFMDTSRQFWHRYVTQRRKFFKLLVEDRRRAREIRFPEVPKIEHPLSESIERSVPDVLVLVLLNGVCFMAAYALFARSEV